MSCGEEGAEPIMIVRTDDLSIPASWSLRVSIIAIMVGTPEITVHR
jgi:hypothetical protein